jgi:AAA domain, putative AbiEii toxin, Type IV TA system
MLATARQAKGNGELPMLSSIKIQNFRCFKNLEQGGLKRFNFVVGDGGSGKTALLESIFLAAGGSPEIYFRIRSWRGFGDFTLQNSRESFESLFRDLFFDLDQTTGIVIRLNDDAMGDRSLRVFYGEGEPYTLPLRGKPSPETGSLSIQPLHFRWKSQTKTVDTKVYIDDNALKITGVQDVYPVHFISPLSISPTFSAVTFSQLSKANRQGQVLESVRTLFPAVREITCEAVGGGVMLYAAFEGRSAKLPVAVLSGGMNKYIALVVSILANPGGLILIDEIENGFYYQFLVPMLSSILNLCEQEKVQIIASTHSYEFLQSLRTVIEAGKTEEQVSVFRLSRNGSESVVKYIKGASYTAAIDQGFEVR